MGTNKITAAALFAAAILGLGAWTVHELKAGLPDAAALDMQAQRIAAAENLLQHAKDASVPVVQLLVTAERDKRVPLYKQIDQANASADADLRTLNSLDPRSDARLRVDMLADKRAQYDARYAAAVEEIERDGPQGALENFWSGTRDALARFVKTAEGVVADERQKLADLQAAREEAEAASLRLLGAELLALLLAAVAGAVAVRRP